MATASVAAADITLGGFGRFGIQKAEGADATVDSRVSIDIKGSAEAGDLTFGGMIRLRSTDGGTATTNGAQLHMKSGAMTVFAGNIPGPLDSMAGVYGYTVGYSGGTFNGLVTDGDSMAFTSNGGGANGLQVNYSMSGLTVKAAHSPQEKDEQFVVEYAMGAMTAAAGAQMGDVAADDVTVASLSYSLGDWGMTIAYGDNNGTTKTTLSAGGNVAAATSLQFYASDKDGATDTAFGVGVKHDLGGATLGAAYETTYTGTSVMEAGVRFNF